MTENCDQYLEKLNPEEVYEIIDLLGEGSYGKVYKSVNKKTATVVALKLVCIENDEQETASLMKEIDILKRCSSPFIVRYYESFLYESRIWISMEYCDAGSISDIMESLGRCLKEKEIAAVCANVIQGLHYLHENKNIHRDIKAGNILLARNGLAKLADFGVSAQLSNTMAKRNTVIGTPFWMAPEVIQESQYDGKADIWSLGITAIELAQGDPPLYNMHPMRAIFLIPSRPPPALQNPNDFSEQFNDFITVCLKKNPKERPSAKELFEHPFLSSEISTLRVTMPDNGLTILQDLADESIDKHMNSGGANEFIDFAETTHGCTNEEFVDEPNYTSNYSSMIRTATSKKGIVNSETLKSVISTTSTITAGSPKSDIATYETMIFRDWKPNKTIGKDVKGFYGTVKEDTEKSATMVQRNFSDMTIRMQEDEVGDEPAFMKYFNNSKDTKDLVPEETTTMEMIREPSRVDEKEDLKKQLIDELNKDLLRLTEEYQTEKKKLKAQYIANKELIEEEIRKASLKA